MLESPKFSKKINAKGWQIEVLVLLYMGNRIICDFGLSVTTLIWIICDHSKFKKNQNWIICDYLKSMVTDNPKTKKGYLNRYE